MVVIVMQARQKGRNRRAEEEREETIVYNKHPAVVGASGGRRGKSGVVGKSWELKGQSAPRYRMKMGSSSRAAVVECTGSRGGRGREGEECVCGGGKSGREVCGLGMVNQESRDDAKGRGTRNDGSVEFWKYGSSEGEGGFGALA
jgi:hypothetical protein